MPKPFRFATIELLPYPALGEFVIVGVAAVDGADQLEFKTLPANCATRLTQFFPEIERTIFTTTLRDVREEITAVGQSLPPVGLFQDSEALGSQLFPALTAAREGMIRINARGTGVTDNLAQWVNKAFERYVNRISQNISQRCRDEGI